MKCVALRHATKWLRIFARLRPRTAGPNSLNTTLHLSISNTSLFKLLSKNVPPWKVVRNTTAWSRL